MDEGEKTEREREGGREREEGRVGGREREREREREGGRVVGRDKLLMDQIICKTVEHLKEEVRQ